MKTLLISPAAAADARSAFGSRGFDATQAYWFSMLAASALGTNLGDFWVDGLSLDRMTSFATLAVISGLAIWMDSRIGARAAAGYWLAIVVLRAAATNVGDFLTHDLGFGYLGLSVVLAVATLIVAKRTRIDGANNSIPRIDKYYWIAMLIAGVFGTVSGDLAAHMIGLYAAAGGTCLLLCIVLVMRTTFAPASIQGYWIIVLTERCAGTPVGDALASRHAFGFGLPLAMLCTGGLFIAGLLIYSWRLKVSRRGRLATAASLP